MIPEFLAGKTVAEVEQIPLAVGNREMPTGELFDVQLRAETPGETTEVLEFEGDLSGVHWIGARMQAGQIRVHGPAGRHLGSEMTGGRVDVFGNAGDWVGAEMRGGLIHVRGNAGHLVGAAYRGSRRGMVGGTILVDGSVGNELGHTLRRGLIAVGGEAGDLIGFNLLAGTILVFGQVGIRHGAGMKRGTLALLGGGTVELLPSFRRACTGQPLALVLLLRQLRRLGFAVPESLWDETVEIFNGDFVAGGRGEVFLRRSAERVTGDFMAPDVVRA